MPPRKGLSLERFVSTRVGRGGGWTSVKQAADRRHAKIVRAKHEREQRRAKHEPDDSLYSKIFDPEQIPDHLKEERPPRRKRQRVTPDGKRDPLARAKWERAQAQKVAEAEKEKSRLQDAEKKKARKRRQKARQDLVWKRTRHGQPVMANAVMHALAKLEKDV